MGKRAFPPLPTRPQLVAVYPALFEVSRRSRNSCEIIHLSILIDTAYTNIDAVVHEHVISNNLYAKRGVKIRRRRKMTMKTKNEKKHENENKHAVKVSEMVLEHEIEDESDPLAVSIKRFVFDNAI